MNERAGELMQAYLERAASPAEERDLALWLAEDCANLTQFLWQCRLDSHLTDLFAARELTVHFASLLEEMGAADAAKLDDAEAALRPDDRPRPARSGEGWFSTRLASRRLRLSLLAACVAVMVFLFVLSQMRHLPNFVRAPQDVGDPAVPASPMAVARLVGTHNVSWSSRNEPIAPGAPLLEGRSIVLEAGVAEFRFMQGTGLLVSGPAALRLNANGVQVEHGVLVARVPKRGIGFYAESSAAKVVDMGTEFGLRVEREGRTEVHVFDGSVSVEPNTDGDRRDANRADDAKHVVVSGQAVVVDAQRSEEAAEKPAAAPRAIELDRRAFAPIFDAPTRTPSGVAPTVIASRNNSVPNGTIQIDGRFDDWEGIEAYPDDSPRDATTDPATSVDIVRGAIAHDEEFVYLMLVQAHPVGLPEVVPWIFFDTDKDPQTGARAAPFGNVRNEPESLPLPFGADFNLCGSLNLYRWKPQGHEVEQQYAFGLEGLKFAVSEDRRRVEYRVPRALLANPRDFYVAWIAHNRQLPPEREGSIDYYPDAADSARARGCFHYALTEE